LNATAKLKPYSVTNEVEVCVVC